MFFVGKKRFYFPSKQKVLWFRGTILLLLVGSKRVGSKSVGSKNDERKNGETEKIHPHICFLGLDVIVGGFRCYSSLQLNIQIQMQTCV